MLRVRAARRYRWRLAGGHLVADGGRLTFTPNRLERRLADTRWECTAGDVRRVQAGRIWLSVQAAGGTETFRVFGATPAAERLRRELDLEAS